MNMDTFYIGFSIFIFNFHNGLAIPHEYCLGPLNRSDCGRPSTPVLTYYKPGSRCEIDYWRGCPTINKFDDEFICSHFCIGKLWGRNDIETNDLDSGSIDRCSIPLDVSDCGSKPTTVYTYDGYCKPVVWRGCRSKNMFIDYNVCVTTCQPTLEEWKEEIEVLNLESMEKLDNFLDDVVETVQEEVPEEAEVETVTEEREKMALQVDPEPSEEEPPEEEQPEEEQPEEEQPEEEPAEPEEEVTEEPAAVEEEVTEPPPEEDDESGDASEVITT